MTRPPGRKQASLFGKLMLSFGVLAVGLLLLEGAARIRLLVKFGRTDNEFYRSEMHPEARFRVPVPDQQIGSLRINSHGFRGEEIEDPKPEGRIRIAFLGASTTFCAEVSASDRTWPARLIARLAERFEPVEFDQVNGGIPGIGADESLRNLRHRIAPLSPDVVVIYHATNDLSRDTRKLAEQQGLFTVAGDERSFLARISVGWDLIEKNLKVMARKRAASAGEDRLQYDAEQLAAEFHDVLTRLVEEARGVSRLVVLVTFSTRLRAEQTPEEQLAASNTSLLYMPYMTVQGLLDGFAAYNRTIRDVAAETGAVLVADENSIPSDAAHFRDSVHLTDQGCELMAERLFEVLQQEPRFLNLVAEHSRAR